MKLRFAYCYPEQMREGLTETGRPAMERIPGHPYRQARATDANTWLMECDSLGNPVPFVPPEDDTFEDVLDRTATKNRELFRRLADQ